MKQNVLIRDEKSTDYAAISKMTVAAFETMRKVVAWSVIRNTIDNSDSRMLKDWSTKAFPMKCFSLFHLMEIFRKVMSCFMKDSKQMANKLLHRIRARKGSSPGSMALIPSRQAVAGTLFKVIL